MAERKVIFVVLGRLGKNLSISKLAPICELESVSKVYAFSESKGFDYGEKLIYLTLPKFVITLKPTVISKFVRRIYEPIQLLLHAISKRPDFINGVYTLPKGFNSFVVSKLTGIKCIISIIGGKEEIESDFRVLRFWRFLNIFMIKKCYAVTCKGRKDFEYISGIGVKRSKIFVYNGGIDIFRFRIGETARIFDLVFAGRLDINKGPLRVLGILKKVKDVFPDIRSAILGDGNLRADIERCVENDGLQQNVVLFGHVPDPETYFRQAKVFVLPSTNEGLSTAMLESMSCGCVPVVSDVGNTSEAVKNGINGFIIEQFDDISSFAERIILLMKEKDLLEGCSKNAVSTIINNYSYKVQSGFFGSVIDK
jgi:glycosyltransferase involved in cell wall biosynthesis